MNETPTLNVLIVDDDEPWANVAAALLRPVARRVRIAGTYADALKTIRAPNGFDVVMLDLTLPDSSPGESLARIPAILETGRQVVVMTGQEVDEHLVLTAKRAGAVDVLYKADMNFANKLRAAVT